MAENTTPPAGVGRPRKGPRKDIHVRVPDPVLLELFLLRPELLDAQGGVRYGGLQEYLLGLLRADLERLRRAARKNRTPAQDWNAAMGAGGSATNQPAPAAPPEQSGEKGLDN